MGKVMAEVPCIGHMAINISIMDGGNIGICIEEWTISGVVHHNAFIKSKNFDKFFEGVEALKKELATREEGSNI